MDRNRRLSTQLCLLLLELASQIEAREPQPYASRLLDAVVRQVSHDSWIAPSYESSDPFPAVACRPWPDDPAQTIIAMAYLDPGDIAVGGKRHPHLLLAKADSRNGRLLERYDNDFEEDASVTVNSGSFWLGTTRYRLSPTARVFDVALRSVARGTSCPRAGSDNLLTLMMPAGDSKLWPVLNTYLDQWRTLKGSVCSTESGSEQEVSHLTLELGRGRSNGFADLVVISRVNDSGTENDKLLRTVECTLRYDGKHYPFEEYLDFWHCQ